MNWLIFAIAAYVAFALETGLATLLVIGQTTPSLLLILAVFLGLTAPGHVVPWAMLALGLLSDLQPGPVEGAPILGPAALGYFVGGLVLLQVRSVLVRESPLVLGLMVLVAGIFVELTTVMLYTARGLPLIPAEAVSGWSWPDELVRRFLALLYSAIAALPLGALLHRTSGLWQFTNRIRGERPF